MTNAIPDENERSFKKFTLRNQAIKELKRETFAKITFETVEFIDSKNLDQIDPEAFSGTNIKITKFIASNTPMIKPDHKNNSLFRIFSSMQNLELLDISNSSIDNIPNDAFRPLSAKQKSLNTINLRNSKIGVVGDRAFYSLPNLKILNLSGNHIDVISKGALELEKPVSGETWWSTEISIDLSKNNLGGSSFKNESLNGLCRTATITLDLDKEKAFLEKNVFKSFFDLNSDNKIKLDGLDCQKCESYWLLGADYTHKLDTIKCLDHKEVADNTHFKNCTLTYLKRK
jgi:Leucine-rich repeat (LRR) protein